MIILTSKLFLTANIAALLLLSFGMIYDRDRLVKTGLTLFVTTMILAALGLVWSA